MRVYAGIDLHSNNSYLGIDDEGGGRVFHRKLANEVDLIVRTLKPFKERIEGIAVESTLIVSLQNILARTVGGRMKTLLSIPGVGTVLALTIMLETGPSTNWHGRRITSCKTGLILCLIKHLHELGAAGTQLLDWP